MGQAAVQRCNATVNFFSNEKPFFPPSVNDKDLHKLFQKVAGNMFGSDGVKEMQPLMGSEDFAFYQEVIPGYFFFLGMKDDTMKQNPLPHSPYFRLSEDGLPYGAAMHASLVVRYLLEQQMEIPVVTGDSHDEL